LIINIGRSTITYRGRSLERYSSFRGYPSFGCGSIALRAFRTEGVLPLSLDETWDLLHAHVDEDRLRKIHPRIISGQSLRESEVVEFQGLTFPREKVAERVIRIGGRPTRSTWTYRIEPPIRYAYEVVFPNGSTLRVDNTYSSFEGATLVKTSGAVSLKRVPSFLAVWIVKRLFSRSDREDFGYAKRMNRPTAPSP